MSEQAENWNAGVMPAMLVSTAGRLLARLADTRLRKIGISISHFPVLAALKDGKALSQKELARIAGVEQPSMAQLLSRMERDDLIRREPDPKDGRSSLVSLTDSAIGKRGPAREILAMGNGEAVAGFNQEEIDTFVELLQRVIVNVNDASKSASANEEAADSFAK
ncbi:MarR family winged helix-turn-helix transcriptional regulator [Kaistia sp. 32K]|uniref:MarR family winged helix-turn-helix transcriptional regulator n=1 Tax=Kaistia sp. 32K TaxID=2795690 RepID=UPI001FD3CBEE|nr:MarR family transcriptional regulator [Kaistia sp. 32K]